MFVIVSSSRFDACVHCLCLPLFEEFFGHGCRRFWKRCQLPRHKSWRSCPVSGPRRSLASMAWSLPNWRMQFWPCLNGTLSYTEQTSKISLSDWMRSVHPIKPSSQTSYSSSPCILIATQQSCYVLQVTIHTDVVTVPLRSHVSVRFLLNFVVPLRYRYCIVSMNRYDPISSYPYCLILWYHYNPICWCHYCTQGPRSHFCRDQLC